ncbi:BrnA antitoxin family protein [Neorhizobium sp. CSC1952]|jgi:Uncharacterized protein conserved in bacteria|uniref:BrnA antitoxin family protein n=1 Tax=Neorhizobium sp. CSC1952 TaxID=2978974 RepID=UPI0025A5D342|nr:BrnA antitoxin family protein [Rhizobium sp. CSC1952]WJR66063.1 BrnA antitoxin family protein [Rhizobium sp. CSC1952]
MSKNSITTVTLDELRLKRARGEKSLTDWARVEAMTDEDIDRAIADDPDWEEFKDIDWSKAEIVVPAQKKSISIRVDEDVIDFFKSTGKGYQTRINAVLKHYVREQKRQKK